MSLISVFVDAFKKAIGREPAVDIEEVRSSGGLGPSIPTDAFDPLRPAQQPSDSEVTHGSTSVASADPEEGGEVSEPEKPPSSST